MVQAALYQGDYGLPGGEHLYQVLAKHGHETDWAEVLKDGEKVSPVLSQQARYWVDDYVKQHGRLPPPTSERVADTNITWDQLKDRAGRVGPNISKKRLAGMGTNGWSSMSRLTEGAGALHEVIPDTQTTWAELDRLIKRHSPIGEYKRKGLAGVAKQILEWRPELVQRHGLGLTRDDLKRISKDSNGDSQLRVWIVPSPDGEFPQPTDELVPGTQVTWSDLEEAARKCMANYPFAKSLVKGKGLIDFYCYCMGGVGLVGKWVEATGTFPTVDSGELPGHRGLIWADVYESYRRCGGLHHSLVNSWMAKNLHTWVSRYVRAHGAAPARDSGPIHNSGGFTWADMDDIIQQNHHKAFPRGLPKDRSRIEPDRLPYVYSDLSERISDRNVVERLQKGVADGQ